MNSIIYKSLYRTQCKSIHISYSHLLSKARPCGHTQSLAFQYQLCAHFASKSSSSNSKKKKSESSGSTTRLKSKLPPNAKSVEQEPLPSKISMFAQEAKKLEESYRWMSPRTTIIVILIYLAVSFSLFGYMRYHRLYASRHIYTLPFLLSINPERAHQIALRVHKWPKFVRRVLGMINNPGRDATTKQKIWGLTFLNPIGLAAGFDKHAECINGVLDMGFGFCEVGTVTPNEQHGNEKPRVWRLKKDLAAINNFGDNSVGHDCVRARLLLRIENMDTSVGLVGVNLGKNAETPPHEAVKDYVLGIEKFVDIADYLVFNIELSSTEQRREELERLLKTLMTARDEYHEKAWQTSLHTDVKQTKPPAPPLMIKIGVDCNREELEDIAAAAMAAKVDGIIVGNGSSARQDTFELQSKEKLLQRDGELTGKPIFHKNTEQIRIMYKLTSGQIPLIGVGGISSARDAYAKIKAGASLVQLYTAYTYNGPFLIRRMIREIGQYAELDGFERIDQAVGCEVRPELGMDPLLKLSIDEEELMSPIQPMPQKSVAARMYGVLDSNYVKVTDTEAQAAQ